MTRALLAVFVLAAAPSFAAADDPAPPAKVAVGQPAPAFKI